MANLIAAKPAVLVFWATDAQNDEEMGALQKAAVEKGIDAVAVDSKDNAVAARQYFEGKGWNRIMLLMDTEQRVKVLYDVSAAPVYFLIRKDGVIHDKLGITLKPDLERKLDELIRLPTCALGLA